MYTVEAKECFGPASRPQMPLAPLTSSSKVQAHWYVFLLMFSAMSGIVVKSVIQHLEYEVEKSSHLSLLTQKSCAQFKRILSKKK